MLSTGLPFMPMSFPARVQSLDILRFVAVLLVMGHHAFTFFYWDYGAIAFVSQFLKGYGYLGVDLFFVLSGFLVSGLLFKELQQDDKISIGRFLIRRGFKIYPAYYFLLIASPWLPRHGSDYVRDVFFYSNYAYLGTWGHLWSLCVEEHFYILLPLLLTFVRVKWLPAVFAIVALASIAFRFGVEGESHIMRFPTHMRLDGLMFGVLLAYWHYYKPAMLEKVKGRLWVWVSALILLCIPWFPDAMVHTFAYLGFGIFMINFLEREVNDLGVFTYLGRHSYSIYLWHLPVQAVVKGYFPKGDDWILILNVTWILIAFAVGIVMAKVIELPTLKLRDRLFPRESRPVLTEADATT